MKVEEKVEPLKKAIEILTSFKALSWPKYDTELDPLVIRPLNDLKIYFIGDNDKGRILATFKPNGSRQVAVRHDRTKSKLNKVIEGADYGKWKPIFVATENLQRHLDAVRQDWPDREILAIRRKVNIFWDQFRSRLDSMANVGGAADVSMFVLPSSSKELTATLDWMAKELPEIKEFIAQLRPGEPYSKRLITDNLIHQYRMRHEANESRRRTLVDELEAVWSRDTTVNIPNLQSTHHYAVQYYDSALAEAQAQERRQAEERQLREIQNQLNEASTTTQNLQNIEDL